MEAQEIHRGRLIDHIQLIVRDLGAARRFYSAIFDVLKVPIGGAGDDFFWADELRRLPRHCAAFVTIRRPSFFQLLENLLSIKLLVAAVAACTMLFAGSAAAVGTLIPAAARGDMIYDAARSTIYITEGGNVRRYHIPSASFLAPIALGGQLSGIDLSPDGASLAVADRSSSATEQWVNLVRLSDLAVTKAAMAKEFMEDGMWTVSFSADGTLFATARFAGSGRAPLRRLNRGDHDIDQAGQSIPE